MNLQGASATAPTDLLTVPPPTAPPQRAWWQRFTAKKFLFISIGLHLLLGSLATVWIVEIVRADRHKQVFKGEPSQSKAATHALEHKVQMAKKQSGGSAPPALKRVTTKSAVKVALPSIPVTASAPVTPMIMAGAGHTTGAGFGFGNGTGNGGGVGGNGGGITTAFIGGMRVSAQKLGVVLDTSGSVAEYQQEMHDYVAKVFKGSEVSEFSAAGFFSVKSSKGSMGDSVLEFLNSPKHFDAIYIFSDFGEMYEKARREGQEDLWPEIQKLVKEKKVRLYLHVLPFKSKKFQSSPLMNNVMQLARGSGGNVKEGDMPHTSLVPGTSGNSSPDTPH